MNSVSNKRDPKTNPEFKKIRDICNNLNKIKNFGNEKNFKNLGFG